MKDMGIVQGSAEQAVGLVVGVDTVYIHTDITKIETDSEGNPVEGQYQYHEVQYDKDEYIKVISEKNDSLEQEVINTQIALCEVYEMMGEGGV